MTVMSDEGLDWRQRGACRTQDASLWWPEDNAGAKRQAQHAIAICWADCPVRRQCLTYALDNDERFGVWGGYTPAERIELQQRRPQ